MEKVKLPKVSVTSARAIPIPKNSPNTYDKIQRNKTNDKNIFGLPDQVFEMVSRAYR